ncbi:MAG: FAD:protein FMN transferase [Verrucomicrobia bacterium]|nr:FAD:protein FMN transferase [Verrucomicrobiota bacterium]
MPILLASALSTKAAADALPVVRWEGRTMGSPYTVQVVGADLPPVALDSLRADVETRLKEINRQMSHYEPDSELSRFNRAPADEPFPVSPEFARVVSFSLNMARRSDGAFDPTLGPLINLWGFGEQGALREAPTHAEIQSARAKTGWRHVEVTSRGELVKHLPALGLNLSAVAKGFAVDEVVALLARRGWTNVYVAIAGEVRVRGVSPRSGRWRVGIAAPVDQWREDDPFAAVAELSDCAISTSGDYQKFLRDPEGRRLGHILDPRTGRPADNTVAGVSVVAPDSMTADALGTTLFVMGETDGLRFVDDWPGAAALFILREPNGSYRQVASRRFRALTGYQP